MPRIDRLQQALDLASSRPKPVVFETTHDPQELVDLAMQVGYPAKLVYAELGVEELAAHRLRLRVLPHSPSLQKQQAELIVLQVCRSCGRHLSSHPSLDEPDSPLKCFDCKYSVRATCMPDGSVVIKARNPIGLGESNVPRAMMNLIRWIEEDSCGKAKVTPEPCKANSKTENGIDAKLVIDSNTKVEVQVTRLVDESFARDRKQKGQAERTFTPDQTKQLFLEALEKKEHSAYNNRILLVDAGSTGDDLAVTNFLVFDCHAAEVDAKIESSGWRGVALVGAHTFRFWGHIWKKPN